MSVPPNSPDTIILVHGFWVTPRSWEHWITHYEAKGFRVLGDMIGLHLGMIERR